MQYQWNGAPRQNRELSPLPPSGEEAVMLIDFIQTSLQRKRQLEELHTFTISPASRLSMRRLEFPLQSFVHEVNEHLRYIGGIRALLEPEPGTTHQVVLTAWHGTDSTETEGIHQWTAEDRAQGVNALFGISLASLRTALATSTVPVDTTEKAIA